MTICLFSHIIQLHIRVKFETSKFVNVLESSHIRWQKQTTQEQMQSPFVNMLIFYGPDHGQSLKIFHQVGQLVTHKVSPGCGRTAAMHWVSCDRTCCSGQFEEHFQRHMYWVESFKHMLVLNIWWWLSPWIIWWFFQYFWESSVGGCFETSWLDKLTLDDDWRKLLYPMCFARSFALVNWSDGNHWEWL